METATPAPQEIPALSARLRRAGAVVVEREGQPVVANYGSVAAEVAVCLKSVGLAVRGDLLALNLSGDEAWLEALLEEALGEEAPPVGRAHKLAGTWCARIDRRSALLVGGPSSVQQWRWLVSEADVAGSPVTLDRDPSYVAVSLIGPRVQDLLRGARLTANIPVGSVRSGSLAGVRAILVGEEFERVLLLLESEGAPVACQSLFDAGALTGFSLVGADAIARLTAAKGDG